MIDDQFYEFNNITRIIIKIRNKFDNADYAYELNCTIKTKSIQNLNLINRN